MTSATTHWWEARVEPIPDFENFPIEAGLVVASGDTERVSDAAEVLSAAVVAAALAPIIDRLRLAVARRVQEQARELAARLDLSAQGLQTLSMLRNAMPNRIVDRAGISAVFVYSPPELLEAAVMELAGKSLIAIEHGTVVLRDRGRESLAELYAITISIIDELWTGREDLSNKLAGLANRAVAAAAATGGPAFAVMAPPWEPPDASMAMLLAERLTPLRFHRFDAHVAAWKSAGLTVEAVRNLPPGDQRDAIEADTNERAAAPYEALTPTERFELCAGLGALAN